MNKIDKPYLKRRDLLRLTGVSEFDIDNWTRRGLIEKRTKRLYSSRHLLRVMCLRAAGKTGLGLDTAEVLIDQVQQWTAAKMQGGAGRKPFYLIFTEDGIDRAPADLFNPPQAEWFVAIDINVISERFIQTLGE